MYDLITDFESVTPDLWMANEEGWKEKLLNLPNWFQIPLINCNASHNLADGTLVRFRGMIQDMYNPEFYFEHFEILNTATNEIKMKSGKYRDTANILENEKINYTQNLLSSQRQTMVVVSLPGYNEWAQSIEHKENHLKHLEEQPNTSKRLNQASAKLKRSYEEADDDSDAMEVVDESVAAKEPKTSETRDTPVSALSREHLLNFPLPDVPSKSCIVKIYTESDNLKLNEMIEVVGFLSVDPALSAEFQPEKDPLLHPQSESDAEVITHNPPPSLVPRLHAVYVKKLEHCNPLVKNINLDEALEGVSATHEHLLKAFTELLLGDALAAEYLICHLISSVYVRGESLTLGHLCLNISCVPSSECAHYTRTLYDTIQRVVTNSYYLPLTVDNLNTHTFTPKKDYECNRLTSGLLQLSKGTHLVLDETAMEPGRLEPAGVANLSALGELIQSQTVEYDFKYYKMQFEADVPVLVLSEGKSLLPCSVHVPLCGDVGALSAYEATAAAATHYLSAAVLRTARRHITALRHAPRNNIEGTGDRLQFVQDDFIEMRSKCDPSEPVTADDLHRLLVVARLVGLTRGRATLDRQCWDIAKGMEEQRRRRLREARHTLA